VDLSLQRRSRSFIRPSVFTGERVEGKTATTLVEWDMNGPMPCTVFPQASARLAVAIQGPFPNVPAVFMESTSFLYDGASACAHAKRKRARQLWTELSFISQLLDFFHYASADHLER